ncbi:MAG: ribbon-helix-helix protein, CopG family [Solirubrobacterales bacterium]|nr:ribbon-helix-helix protein, CopG family [Solirubrobacterales bacterium]
MQLSDELLAELDALRAQTGGRSRSELIREAREPYLEQRTARARRRVLGPAGAQLVNRGEVWWFELPDVGHPHHP